MEPLVWKVQLNFDDAIKQADAAIKDLSARASKVSTTTKSSGGSGASDAEKALIAEQKAAEKLAAALDRTVISGDKAQRQLKLLAATTPA